MWYDRNRALKSDEIFLALLSPMLYTVAKIPPRCAALLSTFIETRAAELGWFERRYQNLVVV